jgi:hypothetical protein
MRCIDCGKAVQYTEQLNPRMKRVHRLKVEQASEKTRGVITFIYTNP